MSGAKTIRVWDLAKASRGVRGHQTKNLPIDMVIGNVLVMKARVMVDEVGRLVLPKNIREAIGVRGRTAVEVEVVDNAARITAPDSLTTGMKRKRGRLVYAGPLPGKWDSGEAVLRMRERRLRP